MRLALTSASGCSVCIWHTTTSSSRAGETSACSAWGLTWHRSPFQDGASRGIVAPGHLSYYHCLAYTTPGVKAPPRLCPHDRWSRRTGGGPVVLTLLESKWKTGFASLAIHSAMIAGVVYATLDAAPRDDQIRMDTRVVLLAPQEQQNAADPPPVQLADALQGFQPVAVSAQIPIDMPPVDLQQRFDPKDYSGSGVEGSRASDMVVSGNEVYAEELVEERPALLSAPAPVYPALLKQAGIQGRGILPAVIDTTGRGGARAGRVIKRPPPAVGPTPQGLGVQNRRGAGWGKGVDFGGGRS